MRQALYPISIHPSGDFAGCKYDVLMQRSPSQVARLEYNGFGHLLRSLLEFRCCMSQGSRDSAPIQSRSVAPPTAWFATFDPHPMRVTEL